LRVGVPEGHAVESGAGAEAIGATGSPVLAYRELVPACEAAVPGPCPGRHCGRPGTGLMRRPEARDPLA